MTHTPNFSAVRVLESTLELEEVGYVASTKTHLCSLSILLSLFVFFLGGVFAAKLVVKVSQ